MKIIMAAIDAVRAATDDCPGRRLADPIYREIFYNLRIQSNDLCDCSLPCNCTAFMDSTRESHLITGTFMQILNARARALTDPSPKERSVRS